MRDGISQLGIILLNSVAEWRGAARGENRKILDVVEERFSGMGSEFCSAL